MQKSLHSSKYERLANWLKEKREAKGLSMRDLAEKLGTTHSFVGKIEQRERRLDVVEYLEYCEALDAPPQEGIEYLLRNC